MKRLVFLLSLLVLLTVAFCARCWSLREVFVDGRIYFADPDCYSRMTRARTVTEGHQWVIKHHDFENFPQGMKPHTTAPMDIAIAGVAKGVSLLLGVTEAGRRSVLRAQSLDVAGAIIGPLLGVLACLAVALALPRNEPGEKWRILAAVLILAVSPIVVHGTLLGRPDHQALLIPLLALALALEFRLMRSVSQRLAVAAGLAWGLALWVSLYEPVVLLALTWIGFGLFHRRAFQERERMFEWGTIAAIFAVSVLIDGWRLQGVDASMRTMFARWSQDIAELKPLYKSWPLLWTWIGFASVVSPIALGWLSRRRLDARMGLWLLLTTFALTLWQLRWGYFLALAFALTLPVQMLAVRRQWIAWAVFAAGLWPIAAAWESQLFPDDDEARRRIEWTEEQAALRVIAEQQRTRKAGPFVAPWWLSPAIAYWSSQPGVAGSSHESLSGIADTARIYLAPDGNAALPILKQRRVEWIVSETPERIVPTSARILGVTEPLQCLAHQLDSRESPPAGFLFTTDEIQRLPGRDFFQVWRVPAQP